MDDQLDDAQAKQRVAKKLPHITLHYKEDSMSQIETLPATWL